MEDAFASVCSIIFVVGYGALSYGVASFASNRGFNFGTFFVLALLFNPIFMFVVVALMSAFTDSAETDASTAAAGGGTTASDESRSLMDEIEARADRADGGMTSEREAEQDANDTDAADEFGADYGGSDSEKSASSEEISSFQDEGLSQEEDDFQEEKSSQEEESVVEGESLDETYEEDTDDRHPEGKVRCDTCYSFVDESASECPACGSSLDSGGGFF